MYQELVEKAFKRDLSDYCALEDAFNAVKLYERENFEDSHKWNKKIRVLSAKYASEQANQKMFELNKMSLLYDAKYDFDAYCQYIEWNREPQKKFYLPRRMVLKTLVDDLQDLADNKLEFLGISLPPRVGKALADDTPVLTRDGWKTHGELRTGDEVVSPTGKFVKVLYVHPECDMQYDVEFSNGETICCHGEHEWKVFMRGDEFPITLSVNRIRKQKLQSVMRYKRSRTKKVINNISVVNRWPMIGAEKERTDIDFYELGFNISVDEKIPSDVYTANIKNRFEFLAGIIDRKGWRMKQQDKYIIKVYNESFKDEIIKFVSTFGWRSNEGISEGVITVSFGGSRKIPCRKGKNISVHDAISKKTYIKDIRRCDPKKGRCITVEGGMYCVGKNMIPTHNSTLCIFFMTWIMGNRPETASVMSGHSDKLTDGFYREILSIITDPTTYLWNDVFPGLKMVDTSAKNETIDLGSKKRFPTITCRSIEGTLTGAVEIGSGGVLYVDDVVSDLQEALNPLRMQYKYDAYLNQLKDRKKMGALELMVGTRWGVDDCIGRIQDQYGNDEKHRFRVIPALNENNESNFNYKFGLGFDTHYYIDMKESIDDATWNAKYQGTPYIREGLLFPKEELKYYSGTLPDGEYHVVAVCDVAWGGGDYLAMVFAYIFENDSVYIHDVIRNNGDKTVTRPVVIGRCMKHRPYKCRFEANNGGHEYAVFVDDALREQGFHTNVISVKAPSSSNNARGKGKLARIIQFSPDIKNFYFIDEQHRNKEYREFMNDVTTFVQTGQNLHDDCEDVLAMLADEIYHGDRSVKVFSRPF